MWGARYRFMARRRAALVHDIPFVEFVRETILVLASYRGSEVPGVVVSSLAPLIERMFRHSWFLATESATRWSVKGTEKRSKSWSPRPAPCTIRCAGTPPVESDRRAGHRIAAPRRSITRSFAGESGALRRMALPQNAHGVRNAAGWSAHGARIATVTGGDSRGRGDDDPRMAIAWRSVQQSQDPV